MIKIEKEKPYFGTAPIEESQNKFIEHRLTALETKITELQNDIKNIRENHLAKIYDKIGNIEIKLLNRLPHWAVIIITFLSSLSVALIVLLATKK